MNSLRLFANVTVGICLIAILHLQHAQAQETPEQTEETELEGTWEVVSITVNGEKEEIDGKFMRVEGNRIYTREDDDGDWDSGTFSLDPSAMPAKIDLEHAEESIRGIYEIDNDVLTICIGMPGEFELGNRPDVFESPEGSSTGLLVFRRVTEEESE